MRTKADKGDGSIFTVFLRTYFMVDDPQLNSYMSTSPGEQVDRHYTVKCSIGLCQSVDKRNDLS